MNRQKKEQVKRVKNNCVTPRTITTTNELGSLSTTFIPAPLNLLIPLTGDEVLSQTNKQEKNMYFNEDSGPDYAARNRLNSRTNDAYHEHLNHLRQKYYMDDHDTGKWSVEDAIQAIKNDKFVYRRPEEAKKQGSYYYNGFDIRFRDPEHEEDHESFNKASATVYEHLEIVRDHIVVADPKDALKKVDAFREHKFH